MTVSRLEDRTTRVLPDPDNSCAGETPHECKLQAPPDDLDLAHEFKGHMRLPASAARLIAILPVMAGLFTLHSGHEAAAAKVTAKPKFLYYEVRGSTVAELRASIEHNGPKVGSIRWGAKTQTDFFSDVNFNEISGGCRFSNVRIRVVTTFTMPKWIGRDQAPAAVKSRWEAYARALRQHEDGHGAIDLRTGRKLGAALEKHRLKSKCKAVSGSLQVVADRIIGDRSENDAYDTKTDHGRTQGAILE